MKKAQKTKLTAKQIKALEAALFRTGEAFRKALWRGYITGALYMSRRHFIHNDAHPRIKAIDAAVSRTHAAYWRARQAARTAGIHLRHHTAIRELAGVYL